MAMFAINIFQHIDWFFQSWCFVNNLYDEKNTIKKKIRSKIPGGGGYFPKNWVGVCGTLPETLTLYQTKICDFRYPIYFRLKPWNPAGVRSA